MSDEPLLIRFREKDSREGITRATMKKIASALDLSETAALHRALVEYAQRFVPQYPRDNGPLSEAQYRKVAEIVRKEHGDAKVTESLFDEPVTGTRPRAAKRVSSSRSR